MKWTSTNFSNPNRLQNYDRVVQSVKDCRQAYSSMSDREFASWYEEHQRVPERRTMAILAVLNHKPGGDIA